MKANKLGIVFVVAVLGLAGVGASYAGFVDTIYIDGTATTGTVDVEVVAISGTWVWKDAENHIAMVHHGWADENGNDPEAPGTPEDDHGEEGGDEFSLEAYATGYPVAGEDDKIAIEWHDLFPFQDDKYFVQEGPEDNKIPVPIDTYVIDIIFHYVGKIPARVQWPNDAWIQYDDEMGDDYDQPDGWVEELMAMNYVNAHGYKIDGAQFDTGLPPAHLSTLAEAPHDYDQIYDDDWYEACMEFPGQQLHFCDYYKLDILFDVPQDLAWYDMMDMNIPEWRGDRESYQGLEAQGYIELSFIQFDEYETPE